MSRYSLRKRVPSQHPRDDEDESYIQPKRSSFFKNPSILPQGNELVNPTLEPEINVVDVLTNDPIPIVREVPVVQASSDANANPLVLSGVVPLEEKNPVKTPSEVFLEKVLDASPDDADWQVVKEDESSDDSIASILETPPPSPRHLPIISRTPLQKPRPLAIPLTPRKPKVKPKIIARSKTGGILNPFIQQQLMGTKKKPQVVVNVPTKPIYHSAQFDPQQTPAINLSKPFIVDPEPAAKNDDRLLCNETTDSWKHTVGEPVIVDVMTNAQPPTKKTVINPTPLLTMTSKHGTVLKFDEAKDRWVRGKDKVMTEVRSDDSEILDDADIIQALANEQEGADAMDVDVTPPPALAENKIQIELDNIIPLLLEKATKSDEVTLFSDKFTGHVAQTRRDIYMYLMGMANQLPPKWYWAVESLQRQQLAEVYENDPAYKVFLQLKSKFEAPVTPVLPKFEPKSNELVYSILSKYNIADNGKPVGPPTSQAKRALPVAPISAAKRTFATMSDLQNNISHLLQNGSTSTALKDQPPHKKAKTDKKD